MSAAADLRWFGLALCGLGLALCGCTGVVQSTDWAVGANGRCASGLGAYKLPATNLKIVVTQDVNPESPTEIKPYVLNRIDYVTRADNRYTYCLDYLASPFADDDIQVNRSPAKGKSNQLLQLITSKAVDQSAMIIRKLIRTIFIGLSQNANFNPGRSLKADIEGSKIKRITVADLEFNPFDPLEVADVNERLRQLGFCVVLEDYTFDRRNTPVANYCSNPRQVVHHSPSIAAAVLAEQRALVPVEVKGVHYRPQANYSLGIYVKDDPGGPGAWRLAKLQGVKLENASPVVALGVDRAIFAERRTILVFDEGVLTHVCIGKGSEILGAIQIPLDVVYGLVALPSQIIQVQIESANLNADVIEAETKVIQAQQALINFKTGQTKDFASVAGLNKEFQNPTKAKNAGGTKEDVFGDLTPPVAITPAPEAIANISSTNRLKDICNQSTNSGVQL